MIKSFLYGTLITASFSVCGSSEAEKENNSKTTEKTEIVDVPVEKKVKIDLSFNMPEKKFNI